MITETINILLCLKSCFLGKPFPTVHHAIEVCMFWSDKVDRAHGEQNGMPVKSYPRNMRQDVHPDFFTSKSYPCFHRG